MVEEGPWDEDKLDEELDRVQDRLYDGVDIAVDGHLASKYPDSKGKPVVIRLDCYETPREPVEEFFQAFAEHIEESEEIQADLRHKGFVGSLGFEYSWKEVKDEG